VTRNEPFVFFTERRLVLLTGRKARNLEELLHHLREVTGASIFYHTHHQFLSQHFETPVFHNEFAAWVSRALQEERLSELLVAMDLLTFFSVRQIREAVIATIEDHVKEAAAPPRDCRPGDEFHFCESMSFIMPTGHAARDVGEFFALAASLTNASLFFHFFEARLRLGKHSNDFSSWLEYRGHPELAAAINKLDPYTMSLDQLRTEITACGRRHGVA